MLAVATTGTPPTRRPSVSEIPTHTRDATSQIAPVVRCRARPITSSLPGVSTTLRRTLRSPAALVARAFETMRSPSWNMRMRQSPRGSLILSLKLSMTSSPRSVAINRHRKINPRACSVPTQAGALGIDDADMIAAASMTADGRRRRAFMRLERRTRACPPRTSARRGRRRSRRRGARTGCGR